VNDHFPAAEWARAEPEEAGLDASTLEVAREWLASASGGKPHRIVVARGGRMVAEWQHATQTDARLNMASATKSLFSCTLGIAVAEGKVGSADDRVIEYFPEFLEIPEGRGPKPGRHAKPEDRGITFRQLISNTSGYMKPGETPGAQFHYQTFGMNVLCHAISASYGLYDSSDPDRLPGIGQLIETKIRDPIGGDWSYRYTDFDHPPGALTNIFGHSPRCDASARDMARMGLLWRHYGRWQDRQVVPEEWMREATRTAPDIRANCPPEQWCYGYAFWTNDHGLLWPALPRDSFAASGAGRKHVWVCPSLDLVVAQSPGIYEGQRDEINRELLGRIVGAVTD
jgi:CubicO group peptidase (beta-lactamase class C family)